MHIAPVRCRICFGAVQMKAARPVDFYQSEVRAVARAPVCEGETSAPRVIYLCFQLS